jgi:hypothetical protein
MGTAASYWSALKATANFDLRCQSLADTGHVQTAQAVRHSKIVSSKRATAHLSGATRSGL